LRAWPQLSPVPRFETILTPVLFLRYGTKPMERLAVVQAEFKLSEAY
jgi:hypothetical protein